MSTHITKYLAWLAMALTLSSCSCCRTEPPSLSQKDEELFSKYKTKDKIVLKADTSYLEIMLDTIAYTRGSIKGSGTNPCISRTSKIFNFIFKKYTDKSYDIIQNVFVISRKDDNQESVFGFYNGSLQTYYDAIKIDNYTLKKVYLLDLNVNSSEEFPEIFYDSTGFLLATNKSRTIIYK
jgi:hypothetical protein